MWAADITYIPMCRGFVYLVAVVDWHSLKMLTWRVFNTPTADFCVDVVSEVIQRYGRPEIFNTDRGSQFTSAEFVGPLKQSEIHIGMDGKGCWCDNVFVERLQGSVKYEEVYFHAYDSVPQAKEGLARYFTFYNEFYNERRLHQSCGGTTPDQTHFGNLPPLKTMA